MKTTPKKKLSLPVKKPNPVQRNEVWRIMDKGEVIEEGDEFQDEGGLYWTKTGNAGIKVGSAGINLFIYRTKRPLPTTHSEQPSAQQSQEALVDDWIKKTFNPPADPKQAALTASPKPPMQLLPSVFEEEAAKALGCGASKYGAWNWRQNKVEIMTYLGAMRRHIAAVIDGEDVDPESGAHHLGHVAAGCAIVMDAAKHGMLLDNRPGNGGTTK